jgi:hypothetical protein
MKRLVPIALLAATAATAGAQQRESVRSDVIPRDVQQAVEMRWNGRTAIRAFDSLAITNDPSPVDGNVAVEHGPLVVAGHIKGNVLAVNSNVILRPGARVDGDVWVVGGRLEGREYGAISGEIRVYGNRVKVVRAGSRLVLEGSDDDTGEDESLAARIRRRRWDHRDTDTRSDLIFVASAGAYNRVEGLPVNVGPSIQQRTDNGMFSLNAFAVVRTGSTFGDEGDVGHDISSELRFGRRTGPAIGGRLFNVIEPVESWQLTEIETSLAAFLFRRDYRDYFANRGLSGFGRFYVGRSASLTGTFSEERWDSRSLFNPFTLFRADAQWRPNPAMQIGRMHVANATFNYDSRTHRDQPQSGFYVLADLEHGIGDLRDPPPPFDPTVVNPDVHTEYNRGFVDLRSYNRLSPSGQLSLRVVGAGWISGDRLPTERRLSVEGSSALPGFDFRDQVTGFHPGTCSPSTDPSRPANCDRIALAQVEYRGAIHFDLGDLREDTGRFFGARSDASWVIFADAGRGWLVGTPAGDNSTYERDKLPPLSTFRSDVGLGFDFGGLGIYGAKAVSTPEPVNVFVRLHRRF